MAKRDRIDLRVRVDEKEKWMVEAERRGLELSELIRRSVPYYLGKHPRRRPS